MATNQRFWARALFDFNGSEDGDLTFKEDEQIFIVNVPDDSEWWEGMTTSGNRGLLPSNYVERIVSSKFTMDLQDESHFDLTNVQVIGLQDDRFELVIKKPDSEQYVHKVQSDIETFHEQLIKILPSIDLSKDLLVGQENTFFQPSSEITKSVDSLQNYFLVVFQFPTLVALFSSWLNPGRRTSLMTNQFEQGTQQVGDLAETCEEYIVQYDWKPESQNDLELVKGEIIHVLSQTEDGWSFGRRKNGEMGEFPSNYVLRKEQVEEKKVEVKQEINNENRKRPHTIRSLEAFDQLMEKGFVVEILEDTSNVSNVRIDSGMRVQIHCCGMIWEGSQHCTNQFVSTFENDNELVSFTVGCNEVVSGLDQGVRGLCVQQRARITCTPMKSYGDAGFPPFVPPHSNVVFDIEIVSVSNPPSPLPPSGPQILLGKGISSNRNSTIAQHQGRPRSIIFERGDGLNLNDDVLARSYAAMSLNS